MLEKYAIIGAIISAVIAGIFALIRFAVRDVTTQAKQIGRDEVIKESQNADIIAQGKADRVLSKHRTTTDTTDKLSNGRF